MAKGQEAKKVIGNLIIEALGDKFITVQDKKIYCHAMEGSDDVQIAIAMTVPKTPISVNTDGTVDTTKTSTSAQQTELSEDDKKKVDELMKKLGLTS